MSCPMRSPALPQIRRRISTVAYRQSRIPVSLSDSWDSRRPSSNCLKHGHVNALVKYLDLANRIGNSVRRTRIGTEKQRLRSLPSPGRGFELMGRPSPTNRKPFFVLPEDDYLARSTQ